MTKEFLKKSATVRLQILAASALDKFINIFYKIAPRRGNKEDLVKDVKLMAQRKIQPVSDNTDKQRTYATNLKKYKVAVEHGFYFEALLIDYAMMEDRLRSFLYHAGALKTRKSHKIDYSPAKDALKKVVEEFKADDEPGALGIESISGKRKIVRCLLEWTANTEEKPEKDCYLSIVKDHLEGAVDIGGLLECLHDISEWCNYRNEVIHALLNKNIESLNEELAEQAMEGMKLARYLDAQVAALKKGNVTRKKLGLPMK